MIYFMHTKQASTMAHMQLEVEKEMKKKTANKNMVSACNIWQEKQVHCVSGASLTVAPLTECVTTRNN